MPYKIWIPGEEVLSADFNPLVQEQVVATFATAAARTTALPAPKNGQVTWLVDKARRETWNGTRWVPNIAMTNVAGTWQGGYRVRGTSEIRTTDANGNVVINLGAPVGNVMAFVCTGGDATAGEFYMPYFSQWVVGGTTMTVLCRNHAGGLVSNAAVRFSWVLLDETTT